MWYSCLHSFFPIKTQLTIFKNIIKIPIPPSIRCTLLLVRIKTFKISFLHFSPEYWIVEGKQFYTKIFLLKFLIKNVLCIFLINPSGEVVGGSEVRYLGKSTKHASFYSQKHEISTRFEFTRTEGPHFPSCPFFTPNRDNFSFSRKSDILLLVCLQKVENGGEGTRVKKW